LNPQTLAVVGDFTNSAHGGAVVRVVVTLDGLKMASIAVFRIKFHLRTLEASETGENQQRLVGDRGTASTCYLDLILSTIVLEMRTTLSSAGDLLFGQTRGRVLALLYGVPDETFFVRQIARQVETSVGTVQRELVLLADAGLIKRSAFGSQVFYQGSKDHLVGGLQKRHPSLGLRAVIRPLNTDKEWRRLLTDCKWSELGPR
jgi:hypothetical protein